MLYCFSWMAWRLERAEGRDSCSTCRVVALNGHELEAGGMAEVGKMYGGPMLLVWLVSWGFRVHADTQEMCVCVF